MLPHICAHFVFLCCFLCVSAPLCLCAVCPPRPVLISLWSCSCSCVAPHLRSLCLFVLLPLCFCTSLPLCRLPSPTRVDLSLELFLFLCCPTGCEARTSAHVGANACTFTDARIHPPGPLSQGDFHKAAQELFRQFTVHCASAVKNFSLFLFNVLRTGSLADDRGFLDLCNAVLKAERYRHRPPSDTEELDYLFDCLSTTSGSIMQVCSPPCAAARWLRCIPRKDRLQT